MDMIGRFKKSLSIQAVGSSDKWPSILEKLGYSNKLAVQTQSDPYLPTDAISFYLAGHHSLSFFTGAHEDYHKPSDTAEKINYEKTKEIIWYIRDLSSKLISTNEKIPYKKINRAKTNKRSNRGFRIYLGTIPDYTKERTQGVPLSGVIKDGPAEKAGLKEGDVIVNIDAYKIENIQDYVYSLQAIKPGKETVITVLRNAEKVDLKITPLLRE